MASVSSLSAVCMTLPTPPTSRMANRSPKMRRPQRLSHTVELNPDCTRVTMEHQRWRSAGDPDHNPWPGSAQHPEREALGNPCSSGLPPALYQQRTEEGTPAKEGRGSAGRKGCGRVGAWLSQEEGVWQKRGVAQPCRRISGSGGRWLATTHQNKF